MLLIGFILIPAGIAAALLLKNRLLWLISLAVPAIVGATMLALNVYYGSRTDCGALYNPDIGCAQVLSSWTVIAGILSFFILCTVSMSAVIAYFVSRKPHQKED